MCLRTVVLVAVAAAALSAGCGAGDDAGAATDTSSASTVAFAPSSVEATRVPAECGVTEPAFSARDVFTLEAVGETDAPPPYASLTLKLTASSPVGQPVPLTVDAPAEHARSWGAESVDGAASFVLALGRDPTELDASGMVAVVVTVDAMPTDDGQPLAADLHVDFVDGRELDLTLSAMLRTAVVLCLVSPAPGSATGG